MNELVEVKVVAGASFDEVFDLWAARDPQPSWVARECAHENTACRYRLRADGMKMYRYQCLNCGQGASTWLKRYAVPRDEPIEAWDGALEREMSAAFYEGNRARYAAWNERKNRLWKAYQSAYLASDHWRRRRAICIKEAGGWCERCRKKQARHAHHLNYKHFGAETHEDLMAVCDTCHWEIHGRRF